MTAPPPVVPRVAVVAIACVLVFCLYGASPGKALRLHCPAPSADAPSVAHCQLERGRRLGWLPAQRTTLDWADFTLTSRLCDNIPQGGVRFCHRLTLVGANQRLALSEWQTPLAPAAVSQGISVFLSGQGQETFDWTTPQSLSETLQTLMLGLLLTITTWGLGPRSRHDRQILGDDAE